MKKIFIDTNILLDVLFNREEFVNYSLQIWNMCENNQADGYISAISLNNVYYIMAKKVGKSQALEAVKIILSLFSTVALDDKILQRAIEFPHKDFEDTIQIFSAVQAKVDCIITRNLGDFSNDYLPIISPSDFCKLADDMSQH